MQKSPKVPSTHMDHLEEDSTLFSPEDSMETIRIREEPHQIEVNPNSTHPEEVTIHLVAPTEDNKEAREVHSITEDKEEAINNTRNQKKVATSVANTITSAENAPNDQH